MGEPMRGPPPRRLKPSHRHVSAKDQVCVARRPPSVNRARRLVWSSLRSAELEVERHGGFDGPVRPAQRATSARIDWAFVQLERLSTSRRAS